jgi:hypothetical protein
MRKGELTMNYANHCMYSDVDPYEVVRVISDKTIEIRPMKAERDNSVKLEFHVGGFSAHCSNQKQQKWIITSDETAPIKRIRLGKRGWKDAHGGRYNLADKPRKFHDYNF